MDRRSFLKTLGACTAAAVAVVLPKPSLPATARVRKRLGIVLHHTAVPMSRPRYVSPGPIYMALPDGSIKRAA